MANVRKVTTKSGTHWQARWREQDRSCAKNFSSHREARDHANKMEQLVERRGIGGGKLTTGTFLTHFVDELETNTHRSPVTIAVYRHRLGLAVRELGEIPLARLTTAHINRALSALLRQGGRTLHTPPRPRPLSRKTVRHAHRILAVALKRAVKQHLIPSNPATDATVPEVTQTKAKGFSTEQVNALLAAAEAKGAETYTQAVLLLTTGVRRSENLGLAFGDIDFEAGTLTVRRTVVEINGQPVEREGGKSEAALRTIAIPPAVVALLQAQKTRILERALAWGPTYQRDPLYVFPGPGGKALPPKFLTQRMRELMQAAGISGGAPVHRWRHTSGSVLYDLTGNIKVVQRRLGHASHHTTMGLYVHPAEERDREASDHFERILTETKTRT